MDEYISKPLETSELLAVLNKFLKEKAVKKIQETPESEPEIAAETTPEELIPEAETEVAEEAPVPLEKEANEILIAKRSMLEGRILARIIDNLDLSYTILDDLSELEQEALSGKYDILISDMDLLPDNLSQIEERVAIIALSDNDQEEFDIARGESTPQSLTREKLEALIKKYRG
jgi:DNA-binding response OmpR family regulator